MKLDPLRVMVFKGHLRSGMSSRHWAAAKNLLSVSPFARAPLFRWADFVLPSTLQLSPLLELLLEPIGCMETTSRAQLGLQEALVNAVRHGNEGDPAKNLRIRRILTPNWLIWQIQDEGDGVPHQARLGQLPSTLEASEGRGLFLIYECFDDIRWSRKGNRLQVACRRPDSRDETTS